MQVEKEMDKKDLERYLNESAVVDKLIRDVDYAIEKQAKYAF
jgi:hypothetical protein